MPVHRTRNTHRRERASIRNETWSLPLRITRRGVLVQVPEVALYDGPWSDGKPSKHERFARTLKTAHKETR